RSASRRPRSSSKRSSRRGWKRASRPPIRPPSSCPRATPSSTRSADARVTAGMPLQNRVTPFGALVATSARGTIYGNRGGRFHRDDRTLGTRRWASRQWICCVLSFKGRRHEVWGRRYTALFFVDEVTALAAGHRPCFECRRAAATAFAEGWAQTKG